MFHLTVQSCAVAGTSTAPARDAIAAGAASLEQLQDAIAAALGLSGLVFTFFDPGFGEWCAPSTLHDLPASSADEPVRIRVQARAAVAPADAAQSGRRIMLMISRNDSIRGLETNKKLVVVAEDLDELIAQISTKLRLPPGIVVGRSSRGSVGADDAHESTVPAECKPFSGLGEIPDKARVHVWRPAATASLAEQPTTFLIACMRRLEQLGCRDTEGIFRVSGSTAAVHELEQQITETWDARGVLASCTEVHDVAVLLCRWLRNQEALIPAPHIDLVATLVERDADGEALEAFVCALPQPGQKILRVVVSFLQEINSETSKMGPDNLGAVFAPTLVKREDPSLMQQHVRSDSTFVTMLVRRLGQHPAPGAQRTDSPALAEGTPVSSRARDDVVGVVPGTYTPVDEDAASDEMTRAQAAEHKRMQAAADSGIREVAQMEEATVGPEVAAALAQHTAVVADTNQMLDALRSNFGSDLDKLKGSIASSEHATEATTRMKAAAARLGDERQELLARLREQSGGAITPQAFLGMLRDDREFGDQLKTLVLSAISDTICGLTLPTILGERDWGTFEVSGLSVQALGKTPQLNVNIQTGVRVEVVDISIDFQPFQFEIDRHATPKVRASGTGTASCVCSAFVAFSVTTDANKKLEVSELTADVQIQELPMQVLDSTKKVAVAAALKVFAKKGKEAVQAEIRQRIQEKMPVIQTKITALTTKFSGQEIDPVDTATCTSVADAAAQGLVQTTAEMPTKFTKYLKPESETNSESETRLEPEPELQVMLQPERSEPQQTPADIGVIQQTMYEQQHRIADTWTTVRQDAAVTIHEVEFPDLFESFIKDTTLVRCDKDCLCLAGTILLSHTRSRAVCAAHYDELQKADQAKVVFNIPARAGAAQLLVFVGHTRAPPVQVTVNSSVRLGQYNKAYSDAWMAVDVPRNALRVGNNEVQFSGGGGLYIESSTWPPPPGNDGVSHSQRSFDAGATYHVGSLGQTGQVQGEYRVRLRLHGVHPPSGRMISPVVDCTYPAENVSLLDGVCNRATIVSISCRAPSGTRISIATRSGTTPQYRPKCWTDFASSSSTVEYVEQRRTLLFEISTRAVDRYVQVQLTLESTAVDRLVSPEVYSVTIKSAVNGNHSNSRTCVTVSNSSQPTSLVRSLYPFKSLESIQASRLDRLRKLTGIERLVSGSLPELQKIERLRRWTQSQWTALDFDNIEVIDSLDPLDIWTAIRAGAATGDGRHYAALFVGVASSLGFPSRMVVMGKHWAAEVYSADHNKWVCHDFAARLGSSCVYFCRGQDEDSPMSALEVHQAIVYRMTAGIYAEVVDTHNRRQEPLEHDDFSIVTEIQATPSFGLLMCDLQLAPDAENCFDDALWFSGPDETRTPFPAHTSRMADIDYSVNEIRIVAQQAHATANERIRVAAELQAKPLVKVEIQLEHTCCDLAHFILHVSNQFDSEEETDGEAVQVAEQQLPLVLWLPRGTTTINARAIDEFGKECATASLDLACSLRPEAAATMIRAAWRGYVVRQSSETRLVRQALARLRKARKTPQAQKTATKKRSLLTATVRVQESSTTHVAYTVCVFDHGKLLATCHRRYSEFHSLRSQILEILHGHFMAESAALIPFPPKATVRGKTSEKLTQQRAQTLQYVASVRLHSLGSIAWAECVACIFLACLWWYLA